MEHRFKGTFNRSAPPRSSDISAPQAPAGHPQHQTAAPHQPKPKGLKGFLKKWWVWIVVGLLIIVIAGLTAGYVHTKNQLNDAKNPAVVGKTEAQKITNQISGTVQLPTDETPTLATVEDVSKLKSQQFFKNAQNGDKVLVYSKSGKAIIYRPSTKKVIIYSFVSTGANQ